MCLASRLNDQTVIGGTRTVEPLGDEGDHNHDGRGDPEQAETGHERVNGTATRTSRCVAYPAAGEVAG